MDIPADAGAGLGLFENIHGFDTASKFAEALRSSVAENYGHAADEFVKKLVQELEGAREAVRGHMEDFLKNHCPANCDGQVRRVARRFALVAAAGELATAMGILPWPNGEATKGARRCFADWLAQRGGTEPAEVRNGIDSVRDFISRHGASRFVPWTDHASAIAAAVVRDWAGFMRKEDTGTTYYVFPEAFREACGGVAHDLVARALADRGMLKRDLAGKASRVERLPEMGTHRVYVLTPRLFEFGGVRCVSAIGSPPSVSGIRRPPHPQSRRPRIGAVWQRVRRVTTLKTLTNLRHTSRDTQVRRRLTEYSRPMQCHTGYTMGWISG